MRKILLSAAAAVALACALLGASPASADISCYEAGMNDKPGVEELSIKPFRVVVNDGDPYVRRTDCD